jgi:hypothetical protein
MSLRDLECFGSMDWGFNAPGVMLWWVCLPDGRLHVAQEYKFKGETAERVGNRIHKMTKDLGVAKLRYIAADPAMWAKTGAGRGESIAETLLRLRLPMRRSDNDRRNGWLRVHELLRDHPDGDGPWLSVDPACSYLIRTLPAMVQDDTDPEDIDTTGDDHAADALRYGAMSRPSPTRIVRDEAPKPGTWGYETAMQDAQLARESRVLA